MKHFPQNEKVNRQRTLQRLDHCLEVLQEQTTLLLSNIDYEALTPAEAMEAVARSFTLIERLLKLRLEYEQVNSSADQ